jgi:predicted transcriptional regulator of viral defense system
MVVKICIVCQKKFECYDKPKHAGGIRTRAKRKSNSITCSHKCATTYYQDIKRKNTRLYKLKHKKNQKK